MSEKEAKLNTLRRIVLATDGNGIMLEKNECSMLETIQVLEETLDGLRKRRIQQKEEIGQTHERTID